MLVRLFDMSGGSRGKPIHVTGSPFKVGRAPTCDLRLTPDFISRLHCQISVDGDSVVVHDCGSRNGTFVNGSRVNASRELRDGDILTIAASVFEVRIDDRPAPANQPLPVAVVARCMSGLGTAASA